MAERPHVSLRPFEPGDAAAVHRWFNNPEATASLMEQRESFSLADAEAWVGRAIDGPAEDRKYAIAVEGYDEPVGFTALYGLFRQTAPELGALIGDDVRGKGVGRRAEALTIAKAFDEFGAPSRLRWPRIVPSCFQPSPVTVFFATSLRAGMRP